MPATTRPAIPVAPRQSVLILIDALLTQIVALQFTFDSQGRVSFPSPPPLPGGLHRAACRIDGADGTITVLLLVRRAASAGVPTIDYTLTLRTTRALYATDYPAFVRWLSSVRFTRPL